MRNKLEIDKNYFVVVDKFEEKFFPALNFGWKIFLKNFIFILQIVTRKI